MTRLSLPLLLLLSPAAFAQWTLTPFPSFTEQPSGLFHSATTLNKGNYPLQLQHRLDLKN